jgi:hypothetical protein
MNYQLKSGPQVREALPQFKPKKSSPLFFFFISGVLPGVNSGPISATLISSRW